MKQYNPMMIQSPSQTVGPYFAQGLLREGDQVFTNVLVSENTEGVRIRIEGCVFDAEGRPIEDAMIEIWQANAAGRYIHVKEVHDAPLDPNFLGAGRFMTDDSGQYKVAKIYPASYEVVVSEAAAGAADPEADPGMLPANPEEEEGALKTADGGELTAEVGAGELVFDIKLTRK